MARRDELTNLGPLGGNNRSHAMNITKRRWNLNLQKVNIKTDDGKAVKVKVSARTIRTLKKQNRIITPSKIKSKPTK